MSSIEKIINSNFNFSEFMDIINLSKIIFSKKNEINKENIIFLIQTFTFQLKDLGFSNDKINFLKNKLWNFFRK